MLAQPAIAALGSARHVRCGLATAGWRQRRADAGLSWAMHLSDKQLRFLRGRAHALKPVIQIGNKGLSPPACSTKPGARWPITSSSNCASRPADRAARDALLAELVRADRQRAGHAHRPRRGAVQANPKLSKYPLPDA
jgi:hypothetical protein